MKIDDAIQRIENYLESQDIHPRFVNLNNPEDVEAMRLHFLTGNMAVKTVQDYSQSDENLSDDLFFHSISMETGKLMLFRITSYYKLFGEKRLSENLLKLQQITRTNLRLVVVCYQCERVLRGLDPRYRNYIYYVDSKETELPQLIFTNPNLPVPHGVTTVDGVQSIADAVEQYPKPELYVYTNKRRIQYPSSLYIIRERSNAFEALCGLDQTTKRLAEDMGTQEEWEKALVELPKYGTWMKYVSDRIAPASNLEGAIFSWITFDKYTRWLFFVGIKLFGVKHNWCLNQAVTFAKTSNQLVRGVFRSILSLEPNSNDFWKCYEQRKTIIGLMENPDNEVEDYCSIVRSKGEKALYYLTNLSKREINMVFELLAQYAQTFDRKELLSVLEHVYPDLYDYLQPFSFHIPLLDKYFSEYKFQKVYNYISPEFLRIVEEQSEKREYNLLLPARSELLDSIPKKGTAVYFMDAMGVEYVSYIMAECKRRHLLAYIRIARCEIPSLTSLNKEFINVFKDGGADFLPDEIGIKSLDEIKHHGEEEFDYRNNKLPTYLSKELEIISGVIEKIETKLKQGTYKQAVMISDHGASRLCVINEQENKWEMSSKGVHSGRCCPINEIEGKPSCATEENGYWALANYDRFKGGRAANIEVHGGATLEEVVVPIIEIVEMPEDMEVIILTKEISFSRKKQDAELSLFSKTRIDTLSVLIKEINIQYEGKTSDGQTFSFRIPDIKKSGIYHADILYRGNKLVSGLEFNAVNTDFNERELF